MYFYRRLIVVVIAGLAVWALLIYSASAIISQTTNYALSLAGVTGIIVAVGITVDSYVVFFERLKEEVRHGRTVRNSAVRSFKATWRTIVAADLVSLIAAGVLFALSVGSVRGFALYLGVTTVCDLIVCWFFTRPAVLLLADTGWLDEGDTFGLEDYESTSADRHRPLSAVARTGRASMTFVDDSGQGGEPPFDDFDLGAAEPPPTGRRRPCRHRNRWSNSASPFAPPSACSSARRRSTSGATGARISWSPPC